LFPLPNVVLFPAPFLPLHIFEERYKVMTADALKAISKSHGLLQGGWEKNYYGRPGIEPIVCVARSSATSACPTGSITFCCRAKPGDDRARSAERRRHTLSPADCACWSNHR